MWSRRVSGDLSPTGHNTYTLDDPGTAPDSDPLGPIDRTLNPEALEFEAWSDRQGKW